MEEGMKSQDGLAGSLGRRRRRVKRWLKKGFAICNERNPEFAKKKGSETQRHPDPVGVDAVRRERREKLPVERAQGNRKAGRSEEHTSELQSLRHLVCRLLLEKKKNINEIKL